jgi:hypothetical protein
MKNCIDLTVQGQLDTVQLDLEFVFLSKCDDCTGNFLIERAMFLMETNVEERFDDQASLDIGISEIDNFRGIGGGGSVDGQHVTYDRPGYQYRPISGRGDTDEEA